MINRFWLSVFGRCLFHNYVLRFTITEPVEWHYPSPQGTKLFMCSRCHDLRIVKPC